MTKYTGQIGGHSWARGPRASFSTLTAARKWAESYGDTADWCAVRNAKGQIVRIYSRECQRHTKFAPHRWSRDKFLEYQAQ